MLQLESTLHLTDRVGEQHYVLQLEYLSRQNALIAALSTGGFRTIQVGYVFGLQLDQRAGPHDGALCD